MGAAKSVVSKRPEAYYHAETKTGTQEVEEPLQAIKRTSAQIPAKSQGEEEEKEDEDEIDNEDAQSLSSLSDDEEEEEENSASNLEGEGPSSVQREVKKATSSEVSSQRRCHYIEVPVGTSGALKRRVFEVRERKVEPCSKEEQVVPLQPYVCHATTDSIIIRWELSSWSEVKQVSHHELQWTQPSLQKNKYLQVWTTVPIETPQDPNKIPLGQEEGTGEDETTQAEERMELFCDNKFCTLPSRAIHQIDLRLEVNFYGLPGGCPPIILRARTKLGHKGWGQWSPVSEPISTLPRICQELALRPVCTTAHSIHLQWDHPPERKYGKTTAFTLFAAALPRDMTLGEKEQAKQCARVVAELNKAYRDGETRESSAYVAKDLGIRWVELYSGVEQSFTIGVGSSEYTDQNQGRTAVQQLVSSNPSLAAKPGLDYGCLPPEWPILFRLEVSSGSWFHGSFHVNNFESPIVLVRTASPTLDQPSPPYVLPYHGMILSNAVTLHFEAPTAYGNGHRRETHKICFPFPDSSTWFGLDVQNLSLWSSSVDGKLRKKDCLKQIRDAQQTWTAAKQKEDESIIAQQESLRSEGWDHHVDLETHQVIWTNSLTNSVSWTNPDDHSIPVKEYVLRGRLDTTEVRQSYRVFYRGPMRHVTLQRLRPSTAYEFVLSILDKLTGQESPVSSPLKVCTASLATERLLLPLGWTELWDPVTEFVYYHHRSTKSIQWEHPCGSGLDDHDLAFRKKRFKLLHRFHQRFPPAQNVETLKIRVNRTSVLIDSLREFDRISDQELNRRLNIEFLGEDGIDSGGLTTEWYLEVSKAFFGPTFGLVTMCEQSQLFTFVALDHSKGGEEGLSSHERRSRCRFFGRVMAKAIYDKRVLFAPFCSYVWKQLLCQEPSLEDLRQIDPQYHSSLEWILNNDITDILFETFSVGSEEAGKSASDQEVVELVPGGKDIDVTEENKKDYVNKLVAWKLMHSATDALEGLREGFHSLIPPHELHCFSVEEIQLLANGSDEISVKDLRRHAKYANGYTEKSKPVQYFWNVFESALPKRKGEIMSFITGSSKMPLEDLTIQIIRSDEDPESLPTSHTCFNQLVIPVYESQQQLEEKLIMALQHSHGFYMT